MVEVSVKKEDMVQLIVRNIIFRIDLFNCTVGIKKITTEDRNLRAYPSPLVDIQESSPKPKGGDLNSFNSQLPPVVPSHSIHKPQYVTNLL